MSQCQIPTQRGANFLILSATSQCHSYDVINIAAPSRVPVLLSSATSIGPRLRRQHMEKTALGFIISFTLQAELIERCFNRANYSLPRLRDDNDGASSILWDKFGCNVNAGTPDPYTPQRRSKTRNHLVKHNKSECNTLAARF